MRAPQRFEMNACMCVRDGHVTLTLPFSLKTDTSTHLFKMSRVRQTESEKKGCYEENSIITSSYPFLLLSNSTSPWEILSIWGYELAFVSSVWHQLEIIGPFPPPSDCQPSQECINNLLMRASKMHTDTEWHAHIPTVNVRWRLSAIQCASLPVSRPWWTFTHLQHWWDVCKCTLALLQKCNNFSQHFTLIYTNHLWLIHPFQVDQSQMVNRDRLLSKPGINIHLLWPLVIINLKYSVEISKFCLFVFWINNFYWSPFMSSCLFVTVRPSNCWKNLITPPLLYCE